MPYNPQTHHRRSIRLRDYDYSQAGAYFVTLCTRNRECLFGQIRDGVVELSAWGEIAAQEWMASAIIRQEIELDEFVVMPNHIHGIVVFVDVGATGRSPNVVGADGRPLLHRQPRSLGSFIAGYKSITTKRINIARQSPGAPVWQRNYYEHVIRSEAELNRIRRYIAANPSQWQWDENNPAHIGRRQRH